MDPRIIEVIEDTFKLPPYQCEMLQVSELGEDGTAVKTSSSTVDQMDEVPVGQYGTLVRFVGGNGIDSTQPIKIVPKESKSDIEIESSDDLAVEEPACSKEGCDKEQSEPCDDESCDKEQPEPCDGESCDKEESDDEESDDEESDDEESDDEESEDEVE